MKRATLVSGLGLMLCLVAEFALAQNQLFVGAWKANIARSAYQLGAAPASETLKFEPVGDRFKVSLDGVNSQGPYHSEATGKFDGVDVPVLASPPRSARFTYAFRRIDDHTWEIVIKVNGDRKITVRNAVSDDGRTMRSISNAVTNQGGTAVTSVLYEKQ